MRRVPFPAVCHRFSFCKITIFFPSAFLFEIWTRKHPPIFQPRPPKIYYLRILLLLFFQRTNWCSSFSTPASIVWVVGNTLLSCHSSSQPFHPPYSLFLLPFYGCSFLSLQNLNLKANGILEPIKQFPKGRPSFHIIAFPSRQWFVHHSFLSWLFSRSCLLGKSKSPCFWKVRWHPCPSCEGLFSYL